MSIVFATSAVSRLGLARLAIGFVQGLVLYLLLKSAEAKVWPATSPYIFAPALMVSLFLPLVTLVGLGHMRVTRLLAWMVAVAATLTGLAVYDVWRRAGDATVQAFSLGAFPQQAIAMPSTALVFLTLFLLFVAQSLVTAAEADRRPIGSYPTYFDTSWKYAVQGLLAHVFTLTFWLLLVLGAALFWVIGIHGLTELFKKPWFNLPVTAATFAYAIHVVDTRSALVRSVRVLKLTLLSWLLPIIALIAAAFLLTLPFTGLEPLWSTRRATPLLLTATVALILLTNAAYQDGDNARSVPAILRLAGRVAGVTILPLVAISTYSTALRISQYGWTTSRIVVVGALVVAWIYAVGYGWGALDRRRWLKPMELTNVIAAFATIVVALAFLSPIADPTRLAVTSQVARLAAGKVSPDTFDFAWLRWKSGRYGRNALNALARDSAIAAATREKATAILAINSPMELTKLKAPTTDELVANITVYPSGRDMPKGFLQQTWSTATGPVCLTDRTATCEAFFADVDGDGTDEILLVPVGKGAAAEFGQTGSIYRVDSNGTWARLGTLYTPCGDVRAKLRTGEFQTVAPSVNDLRVGDMTLRVQTTSPSCRPKR